MAFPATPAPLQALAQALGAGGGTAQAVAQATAEAYSSAPAPVANALADAIAAAAADSSKVDAAARVIAQALLAGGNEAKVDATGVGVGADGGGAALSG